MIDVNLSIAIDMNMDADTIFQTYANMLGGDYDIRYIVDIYESDPDIQTRVDNRIKRIVKTENSIITQGIYKIQEKLALPQKKYKIMAWIDFVEKGTTADKYYTTDNLQTITVIQQPLQHGYDVTKDAFAGNTDMDLTVYENQRFIHHDAVVDVMRPFAVYQIITTDVEEYITYHPERSYSSIMPSTTRLVYNLFFPLGYNEFLQVPDNFKTGINYTFNITELTPQKEALVASDIVFVGDDTFYSVDFEMLSAEDEHINTIQGLHINLKRNKLTIIRGEFLTKNINDGSVGIDDDFGDEIIINL
jgi:hypothetical protein